MRILRTTAIAIGYLLLLFLTSVNAAGANWLPEWEAAYSQNPYSFLSKDYFARFSRDPQARPLRSEILIDRTWTIKVRSRDTVSKLMAGHLSEFLTTRMGASVRTYGSSRRQIILVQDARGLQPGGFSIRVSRSVITLRGADVGGLRDAVVKLVDLIGLRQAPILPIGEHVYTPRIGIRLGLRPLLGTYRDVAFMGNNATVMGYVNLFALSTSNAIPELTRFRQPAVVEELAQEVAQARKYALKTYIHVITSLLPANDSAFIAHPEIRGAELNFGQRGYYTLCSSQPLVKRYYAESIDGLLRATGADGVMIIVGGEEFYHCFMRPWDTQKGHTNCPHCEPQGAETVVAGLCNNMGAAAKGVKSTGEVVAWPYSAKYFWSADDAQLGMINLLATGTAVLTETEKDEVIEKPGGVSKLLWDYSIDLTGLGQRAKAQVQACKTVGIPVYLKSDHEHAYEAPRLANIPCMDRWLDRADAIASSGATGAWVFPYFYRPYYGTVAGEIGKYMWWDEKALNSTGQRVQVPLDKENLLQGFAARVAGRSAGPHLRNAWRYASNSIDYSPEIAPRYFMGTYYLGPDHPMCADPNAVLPDLFYYSANRIPIFDTQSTKPGSVFGSYYRSMESCLKSAVDEMQLATILVPDRCRSTFNAEDAVIRFFYHTERTQANFYESCALRDRLLLLAGKQLLTVAEREEAQQKYTRWKQVLEDELANAVLALPIEQTDNRLDQMLHVFPPGATLNTAKQDLLRQELSVFLPSLAAKLGIIDTD